MTAGRDLGRAALAALIALAVLLVGPVAAQAAPELTIDTPTAETRTNDPAPPFEGTTNDVFDPVTVLLYTGSSAGGSPVQTSAGVLPTLQGNWATTLPESLPSGQYTAVAEQGELLGEEGTSAPVTFVVDTVAPLVSISSVPSPTNDPTPTLFGGAGSASGDAPDVTLAIYEGSSVGGPLVEEVSVSRSGSSWSHTTATLPDGTYTARSTQTDDAGNIGTSSPSTFTVDTHAPIVSLDAVSSPTKDPTPTFAGNAGTLAGDDASVTVVIHQGGASESKSVAVSGGRWSYTPPALPDGSYSIDVRQEDAAGNLGTAGPAAFTIDTHSPNISINQPASPSNDPTPTLSGGAGALASDSASVLLVVHRGGSTGGEVVESTSVPRSGSSWSHTTGALADGSYTAQSLQEDEAGGKAESSPVTFTIDTQPPVVSIAAPATPTKDSTPTFTGGAGALAGDHASVTVIIRAGASVVNEAKAVAVSGGKWTYTPPALSDGTYTVQVLQSDVAGNLGSSGAPLGFTIDTHVPLVSIEGPPSPTKSSTPTLSGSASALGSDGANVLLVVHRGSVGGEVVEEVNVPRSGASWSHTTGVLADGTYVAQALQEDEAGARGESALLTFVVDTHPPIVTINPVPAKDATPTITGTAGSLPSDRQSVAVNISQGGSVVSEAKSVSVSGGKWTYTAASLADGAYTVQVEQKDTAGNVGVAGPLAFVVDTNAPKPSIDPMAATNNPTPTFTGSAGKRSIDDKTVRVAIYEGASVIGSTPVAESKGVPVVGESWSYTPPPLVGGVYTAQVEQQDQANERGTSALLFVIDTKAPHVTIAQPADNEIVPSAQPSFSGLAGTEAGDQPTVSLSIYAGTAATGTPVQALQVPVLGGTWSSASVSPLPNGIYTAAVEQSDNAGNTGRSRSTFAISVAPPATVTPTPPVASFRSFPSIPHVGETVSLVSTSTPGSSPITGFAWSVDGSSTLTPGPSVLPASFTTAGPHVVRLRVSDADGLTALVSETVTVARAAAVLMQPFPVVRIAGSGSGGRVRISLFTVLAPTGARVTVSCHGRGCPSASQSIIARAGRNHRRAATVLISFARFERSLHAGAVLEIRVTRPGQIGKYTRFTVRRGKLPARVDTCLSPGGVKPMSCPS